MDGLGIHFIHEKGKGPHPVPLVVTHGWPGSFFEMYKIIPRLTDPASYGGDPAEAFDLVVPSMPGYGFSDQSQQRGMWGERSFNIQRWAEMSSGGHFAALEEPDALVGDVRAFFRDLR